MSEARETKKIKNIAFRVTDEEYVQIERVALSMGEAPNNWCRNITVTEAREGSGLTKTERPTMKCFTTGAALASAVATVKGLRCASMELRALENSSLRP